MKHNIIKSAAVVCGLMLGGLSLATQAATISFACISGNDSSGTSCAIGAAQLAVTVTDIGDNKVQFWFTNHGPGASSIADVYFNDNVNDRYVASIVGLIDADDGIGGSSGVDFSVGANPKELPGAKSIPNVFQTTTGLSADSDAPVQPNGVNPGEYLGIQFLLSSGKTYADLLSGLSSGAFRIGIHVQGFNGGYSESMINTPYVTAVPVPAAAWLLGSGLLGMAAVGRRRSA